MSRGSIYPTYRFVPGTQKYTCARCGCDGVRSEMIKEQHTGLIVHPNCSDPKPLQDYPKHHRTFPTRRED